jgi:hypothetical protein
MFSPIWHSDKAMQTGMTIIILSASMRDIPAKPVQGQPFARLALALLHPGMRPGW